MLEQPRRLLHIVDSLQPGGMENILVQLLSRLDPARYVAEVCCLVRSGPFEQRLPAGVKVHVLDKPPGFQWSAVRQLRSLIAGGSFDLVHTHHLGGLIYVTAAAPFWGPKLVHSEHSLWTGEDLSPRRRWQRRLLYHRASVVFSVSQQQLTQIQAFGFDGPKFTRILNGVDCCKFVPAADKREVRRRLGLNPEGRWLGMVARFGAQKRHVELIEAFDSIAEQHPQAHLLLVGDGGPEKERALNRREASAFRDRIVWAGFQQDPLPWYQAMDALVVSSSNEGLPNAVLEGMATGLPIVANDVCGVVELVRQPDHGWLGDYGTVDGLASALAVVAAAQEAQLADLGAACRQHVEQFFSLDAMVSAYDGLYSSLE